MNKLKFTKGFYLWWLVGILLYVIFAGSFTIISLNNVKEIYLDMLTKNTDQIVVENNRFTTSGDDPKILLNNNSNFTADYFDITISELSEEIAYAQLFYSDNEEFKDGNSVRFAITNGLNEINFKSSKYLRLDIADKEGVSLVIDSVKLRSARNPLYTIPQGFILFVLIWLMLYIVGVRFGIVYEGVGKGLVLLAESVFAIFMTAIMLFSINRFNNKLLLILLIPLCTFCIAYIYSKINTNKVKMKLVIPVILLFMTIIMCVVGYKMLSNILTDLGAVYYSAWEIAENNSVNTVYTGNEIYDWFFKGSNNDYFVRYHNNIALLGLLALFYKFLALFSLTANDIMSNYMSVLLNIGFIMLGIIFGIMTAKRLFGRKGMFIYTILSALFIPYYIHACRFYTDTTSFPFVSGVLWLYSIPDDRFKFKYLKYILIGAVICLGGIIKGWVMVLLVAIIIHLLLINIKNIRFATICATATIALTASWGVYIANCSWVDLSKSDEMQFPVTHWFMMGLNTETYGFYSQDDFVYTDSFKTKYKKQRANKKMIMQRIGEFDSLSDLADYEFTKATIVWGEGQYMESSDMERAIKKGKLYDFISVSGSNYSIYKIYITLFAFSLYIFSVIGGVLNFKEKKADYGMFLRLTMFGVIIFFMMWEIKQRYIFNFTPVFMLSAIYGLENLKKLLKWSDK